LSLMAEKSSSKAKPAKEKESKRNIHHTLEDFYNKRYKLLAIIPSIIGVLAILLILMHYWQTGDFMNRGISLKGGATLTINLDKEINPDALESALLDAVPGEEFNIRVLRKEGVANSITIETSVSGTAIDDTVIPIVEKELGHKLAKNDFSVNTIGSSLSQSFFQEMIKILILAFVLMGLVVLIYFRSPLPSFYVILCAFFDMVITLAIVNILGIKMTTAGIAAFLMLINFSIDSDMLLTARILKRDPGITPYQGFVSAIETGMMMTATVFAAVLVAYIFTNSPEIKQIMEILLIGLVVDVVVTWLQNAALCRWYVEAREAKGK
jgi:preprotein translocase subunit SecF